MFSIAIKEVLAKLPVAQLGETLMEFVQPFVEGLPDRRLQRVVPQAVQGILGGQTPVIIGMAQSTSRLEADGPRSAHAHSQAHLPLLEQPSPVITRPL